MLQTTARTESGRDTAKSQLHATRPAPHNIEAELSVIGAILLNSEALAIVLETLNRDDFYRESHRTIFDAIVRLFDAGEPIDVLTVAEDLRKHNKLEEIGGPDYLARILDGVGTAANIEYYARIVREGSVVRQVIKAATEVAYEGYRGALDTQEFLDRAEQAIFSITQREVAQSFVPVKKLVLEAVDHIEKLYAHKEAVTGVATGFQRLDLLLSGLQPSDLIIVAARPSMGKTALALNIAANVGIHSEQSVAFFSLEMSKEQIVHRILCSEARVDSSKMRTGFFSESDWPRIAEAAQNITTADILIDDSPALSVLEMRAKARRRKLEGRLDLILVDYLQLMRGSGMAQSREQEISEISRSLKALAKELGVPVVALSQLNRGLESRTDKRPMLSDLRESGAIEQDADVILFIYRDEMYNKSTEEKGVAEIIVGKQRNGPTGTVKLKFFQSHTRFFDLAPDSFGG